jgi:glycosyltransferase involved in cell wall biosynthesis
MPASTSRRLRIALVGTRGVPARYGGFETAVEEVGRRLVEAGHDVVVYCRTTTGGPRPATHLGMRLVHLPALRRRSLETLSHTGLSVGHLLTHRVDAAIVFNAANAPWLPLLRAARIPVATHVDGLEWKRAKWGGTGKRYYRMVEALSVRWSDALIADAQGIADYYRDEFAAETEQIAYGAPKMDGAAADRLADVDLTPRGYHLVVARFEPENHVDVIVDGYRRSSAQLPLVVVGSAPYADDYTRRVHALADDRVRFLGGVWDQELLDQLYANCATYLHGHSVGGTNPSLLRAIGGGAATIAYDVSFNREVLDTSGQYFSGPDDVCAALLQAERDPVRTRRDGKRARLLAARYDWDHVARGYEALCRKLAARDFPRARPSGRRLRLGPAARPSSPAAPAPASVADVRQPARRVVVQGNTTSGTTDHVSVAGPDARSARS